MTQRQLKVQVSCTTTVVCVGQTPQQHTPSAGVRAERRQPLQAWPVYGQSLHGSAAVSCNACQNAGVLLTLRYCIGVSQALGALTRLLYTCDGTQGGIQCAEQLPAVSYRCQLLSRIRGCKCTGKESRSFIGLIRIRLQPSGQSHGVHQSCRLAASFAHGSCTYASGHQIRLSREERELGLTTRSVGIWA